MAPKAGPAGADLIKDSDTEQFVTDVIDASQQQPVTVEFGRPVRPLQAARPDPGKGGQGSPHGAVKLVKINVDDNQELAGQLRVQSIPAVFGFVKGRPVTAFTGAQPEIRSRASCSGWCRPAGGPAGPSPIEQAMTQADEALAGGVSHRQRHLWPGAGP